MKSKLKPGPEMDAAVARALGWRQELKGMRHIWIMPDGFTEMNWPYEWSTEDACAVRDVLPEIERRGWWYEIKFEGFDKEVTVFFKPSEDFQWAFAASSSLGHAICGAFLEACENAIK